MGLLQLLDSVFGGGGTDSGRRGGFRRAGTSVGRYSMLDDNTRIAWVPDTSGGGQRAAITQRRIYGNAAGDAFVESNMRPIIEVRDPKSQAWVPINPENPGISGQEQGVLLEAMRDGKYDPFAALARQSRGGQTTRNSAGDILSGYASQPEVGKRSASAATPIQQAPTTKALSRVTGTDPVEAQPQAKSEATAAADDVITQEIITSLRQKYGASQLQQQLATLLK